MSVNRITFYDESGILMAGAANAGRKYMARKKAADFAREQGKKAGQKFSYSYRKVAPALGARSQISIIWGGSTSGTVLADGTQEGVSGNEVSMVGFR